MRVLSTLIRLAQVAPVLAALESSSGVRKGNAHQAKNDQNSVPNAANNFANAAKYAADVVFQTAQRASEAVQNQLQPAHPHQAHGQSKSQFDAVLEGTKKAFRSAVNQTQAIVTSHTSGHMIHQDPVDGVLAGNYGSLVPTDTRCRKENEENLSEEQKRRCNATRSSRRGNATLLPVVEEKIHKEHFWVLREMRNFRKFLVINYMDPAT